LQVCHNTIILLLLLLLMVLLQLQQLQCSTAGPKLHAACRHVDALTVCHATTAAVAAVATDLVFSAAAAAVP
jgi:hypothetical protein